MPPPFNGCGNLIDADAVSSFNTVAITASIAWSLRTSGDTKPPYDTTENFTATGSATATRVTTPADTSDLTEGEYCIGVNECHCPDCAIPIGNTDDPDGDDSFYASGAATGSDEISPDGGGGATYAITGSVKVSFGYNFVPFTTSYDYTKLAFNMLMLLSESIDGVDTPLPDIEWSTIIDPLESCVTWEGADSPPDLILNLYRDPTGGFEGGYGDAFLDRQTSTHPTDWLMQEGAATFSWTVT